MQLRELIEDAARQHGTHTAVAQALGVTPQRLNDWKNGHRPCPIHTQAQIAEMAGRDAKEWVWGVVCHQLGRAVAAVALALALALTAGAPGAAGNGRLCRP